MIIKIALVNLQRHYIIILKTYNQTNFFKHTFCEFQQVKDVQFPKSTNYKSKSESVYFYTDKGVYRKSNHWGRVANCRWKLIAIENYKNQNFAIGFAKWSDFYAINSTEKSFFIHINFEEKTAKLQPKKEKTTNFLFTFSEAQKRIRQTNHLFKDEKWTKYFDVEIAQLRFQIISEYIHSNKTLSEIKRELI
ncbi:MAG: hypothetical protein ACWIPJ_01910 [Polaribacter sp.]